MIYLLTIHCSQKKEYIAQIDLDIIVDHLKACGVRFKRIAYENGGRYHQLHIHAIAHFNGRWYPLRKYGDHKVGRSYQIRWDALRHPLDVANACDYIAKQDSMSALTENYYSVHYFNIDNQRFERSEISESNT